MRKNLKRPLSYRQKMKKKLTLTLVQHFRCNKRRTKILKTSVIEIEDSFQNFLTLRRFVNRKIKDAEFSLLSLSESIFGMRTYRVCIFVCICK